MSAIQTVTDFIRPDYLNVDANVTANRKAFLRSVWHLIAPELELQYGVYNSTVAAPAAIFSQAIIDSLDSWRKHTQIAHLIENAAADYETNYPYLELFLANYRIKRQSGTNSVGLVRLIFSSDVSTSFSTRNEFTAKGLTFRPTQLFEISSTGRKAYAQNDQILQPQDNGTFSAVIELVSTDVSIAANLPAGTQLVLTQNTHPLLLEATVIESFVGGMQDDTLTALLPQLIDGITSPVLTSRVNIAAQIKALPNITVNDVSVIGAGDIESLRDKHGLFSISHGGRGDVYVRTTGSLLTKTISKTCELVQVIDAAHARYRCRLSRTEAPAAYLITAVHNDVSLKNLEVVHDFRSIDLSGLRYAPDIQNYAEGAFSAFQTIMLEFVDDGMDRYGGIDNFPPSADYTISYEHQPYIDAIQNYCMDRNNLSVMGDLLVKAAIPCKTSIGFSIGVQQGQSPPDLNGIVAAVVNTVSNTGFMNTLPASIIIEAAQKLLPDGMFVSDFAMSGSIVLPGLNNEQGILTSIQQTAAADKEELAFDLPPYATAGTICFFTDSRSVIVTVKPAKTIARFV